MKHIRTIIKKEWAEIFKNKMVISLTVFMPLMLTLIPLIVLAVTGKFSGGLNNDVTDLPKMFTATCDNLTGMECMQVYLSTEFMLMFMFIPVIIPMTIASYSIVGEKTTRSLEPLLATPISTAELLAGKGLAAALPAIFATWVCFALFQLGAWLLGISAGVRAFLISAPWWMAIGLAGPLMSIIAVNFALMVSSRVNDPRVAEQISALLILPIMGLFFAQVAGLLVINLNLMIIIVMVLAVLAAGLVFLGVRLFQRETILTRWK